MAVYYSRCNHECGVALQEVTLSEASRGFLHKLRFLTLSVNGINRDSAKRDTLGYLMRMDKWDVVYLQETHHNGDVTTPSYAKLFKNCGYEGGWAFLHGVTSTQYMWRCSLLVFSQTLLTGNVRHSSRAYNRVTSITSGQGLLHATGFWGWGSTIASGGVVIFISKRARRCGLKIPGKLQHRCRILHVTDKRSHACLISRGSCCVVC